MEKLIDIQKAIHRIKEIYKFNSTTLQEIPYMNKTNLKPENHYKNIFREKTICSVIEFFQLLKTHPTH